MNTLTDTAAVVLPAVAAAMAVTNPQAAATATVVLQLMQTAMQLQQAGVMTPDQLATLFADIGKGIASTHAQWAALNNAPRAA
jgi:hypothetical protein